MGRGFSWKRATGLSSAKRNLSRKIGVPLTRRGRQQKVGRVLSGGGCFVATACFGDYEHPAVVSLRRFRDEMLRPYKIGRGFIVLYYRYSPGLARVVAAHPSLRSVLRPCLGFIAAMIHRRSD